MKDKHLTFRIEVPDFRFLVEIAEKYDVSVAYIIRYLVKEAKKSGKLKRSKRLPAVGA